MAARSRLANDERLWERVCATLAQIADRNMPGWDAGEMATAALREVDVYLRTAHPDAQHEQGAL